MQHWLGRMAEKCFAPCLCVSSNLSSGEAVVHEFGSLATWVGTSMCVPGVAPPVLFEGELLCDGGVVDNLPTDVMQAMERGAIIASSVSAQSDIALEEMKSSLPDPGALLRRQRGASWPGFGEILLRTATLNSDTQLGLNLAYMLSDNWAVEVLAATPFEHDIGTKGLGGLELGSTKHLPPTVSVLYYPMASSSAFQPYAGLGINYTWMFDDKLSSEAARPGSKRVQSKSGC